MIVFLGQTTRFYAKIEDSDGNPLSVDENILSLYDSSGAVVDITGYVVVEDSEGEYHCDLTIPEDGRLGVWKLVWQANKGERSGIETYMFEVKSP